MLRALEICTSSKADKETPSDFEEYRPHSAKSNSSVGLIRPEPSPPAATGHRPSLPAALMMQIAICMVLESRARSSTQGSQDVLCFTLPKHKGFTQATDHLLPHHHHVAGHSSTRWASGTKTSHRPGEGKLPLIPGGKCSGFRLQGLDCGAQHMWAPAGAKRCVDGRKKQATSHGHGYQGNPPHERNQASRRWHIAFEADCGRWHMARVRSV